MRTLILSLFTLLGLCSLAPAQNYGRVQYQQYQYPVVQQQYYVPQTVIVAVPINPDYYYSVGIAEIQGEKIADLVTKRLSEKFEATPPESKQGEAVFTFVGESNELDDKVFTIMNTQCIKCHKPGAARPGVQLFTSDRKLFVDADKAKERARRERIYDAISDGSMPKGGSPLSNSERQTFKEWRDSLK